LTFEQNDSAIDFVTMQAGEMYTTTGCNQQLLRIELTLDGDLVLSRDGVVIWSTYNANAYPNSELRLQVSQGALYANTDSVGAIKKHAAQTYIASCVAYINTFLTLISF
jgi:hypothetical protein